MKNQQVTERNLYNPPNEKSTIHRIDLKKLKCWTTPLQGLKEGVKSGIGIILVILMVLLLNKLVGC